MTADKEIILGDCCCFNDIILTLHASLKLHYFACLRETIKPKMTGVTEVDVGTYSEELLTIKNSFLVSSTVNALEEVFLEIGTELGEIFDSADLLKLGVKILESESAIATEKIKVYNFLSVVENINIDEKVELHIHQTLSDSIIPTEDIEISAFLSIFDTLGAEDSIRKKVYLIFATMVSAEFNLLTIKTIFKEINVEVLNNLTLTAYKILERYRKSYNFKTEITKNQEYNVGLKS